MDCIFLHLKKLDSMQQQYELNLDVETKGEGIRHRRIRAGGGRQDQPAGACVQA